MLFWDFADLVEWLADEAKAGNLTVEEDEDDEDVQHVAHTLGRVVGILRKLAEAGEIPTGRKPKATLGVQKPAAKKAPTPTLEILPDPPAPLALSTCSELHAEILLASTASWMRHMKKSEQCGAALETCVPTMPEVNLCASAANWDPVFS